MRVKLQTTLRNAAAAAGLALHSGVETRIVLKPASAGAGILFRRADLVAARGGARRATSICVAAAPSSVAEARLGVRLANADGVSVMTVEHLLAAFALCGVDNALVDVFGPELPIFDGSATPFVDLIFRAGIAPLSAPREAIDIRAPVRVEDGDRFVEVRPHAGRVIDIAIDFEDEAIGRQTESLSLDDSDALLSRLAAARTFCTLKDVDGMRAAGFARGGSLENSLVVDGAALLNPSGLRDPKEFVLHKALDLIGDLSLLGAPLYGRICAHKPGHDLNTRLVRRIVADPAAFERRVIPAAAEPARLSA